MSQRQWHIFCLFDSSLDEIISAKIVDLVVYNIELFTLGHQTIFGVKVFLCALGCGPASS